MTAPPDPIKPDCVLWEVVVVDNVEQVALTEENITPEQEGGIFVTLGVSLWYPNPVLEAVSARAKAYKYMCVLTKYKKEDCQNGESHKLNRFASPNVNEREGDPVPRNESCG